MKKLLILGLFALMLGSANSIAQTLEAEKAHEISKNARKGEIYHFSFNEDTREYLLIYSREKKKETLYDVYKYDYDFNEILHEEIEGTVEARKKYEPAFPTYDDTEKWDNPKVLRVENNFGGDIVLRKGYLTREWAKRVEEKGDWVYTTRYLKYDFVEEEKIKPKYEGKKAEVDERNLGFVKKLAASAAAKLTLVDFMTDEPTIEVTTGPRNFVYPSVWARTKNYTNANGDVVILAQNTQFDMQNKNTLVNYVVLKYSATTLEQLKSSEFTYEYPTFVMFKQHLSDGSMAFIVAPASYVKNNDPNPRNYYYIRVSKDAEIIDNVNFESKGGPWKITSINLTNNDEVYIYGQANAEKKDKEPQKVYQTLDEFDNLQVMKISGHKVDYLTSVSLEEANKLLQKPANQKKSRTFEEDNNYLIASPTITSDGSLLIAGAPKENEALHYFHFDSKGNFRAQYVVNIEDPKKTTLVGLMQFLFENNDGTMTLLIPELVDENKGQQFRYPKTAIIDLTAGDISELNSWGYGKKQEFYLDEGYPTTFVNNGNNLVFFSRDKSNKQIWFGRIKLGR